MSGRLRQKFNRLLLGIVDRLIAVLTAARARLSHRSLGAVEEHRHRKDEMGDKIRLLIRLRWAVDLMIPVVVALLAVEGLQLKRPDRSYANLWEYLWSLKTNMATLGAALAINVAYQMLVKRRANLRPIALAQVWLDIVIFSVMIYTTGGVSSPFTFLFTLPVLAASLLLSFEASLAAAFTASTIMLVMAQLQYHHLIPSERYFEPMRPLMEKGGYVSAMVTLDAILYFLIAFSSGALSRTIHKHEAALTARANEATMLYEVSSSLQSTTSLDEVLIQIMDILVARLNIDHALMYLMNEAGDGLDLKVERFHASVKNPPYGNMKVHFDLKREAGLTAICAIEKATFNIQDPANHPLINRELALKLGINPFAVSPMLARGRVVGVVGVDRRFQNTIITQDEAQILSVAANQAGLTISNAKLYESGGPSA